MKRLITIHYAGGNKTSFSEMRKFLPSNIEYTALELPGRGARFAEAFKTTLPDMVDDLVQQITPFINDEYVLFGHSMGGALASLLTQELHRTQKKLPKHVLITGCRSLASNSSRSNKHTLSDAQLTEELKKLGGLPDEVLNNEELMEYFLPIIRADMEALETYIHYNKNPYPVPQTIIYGTYESIDEENIATWRQESSLHTEIFKFEGNHFFILNNYEKITSLIIDFYHTKMQTV